MQQRNYNLTPVFITAEGDGPGYQQTGASFKYDQPFILFDKSIDFGVMIVDLCLRLG